jgi:hypothetical protein
MKPVKVVHARVQSDTPMLVKGRFVSSYGKGDLDAGYLSSLDSVNTASVEGSLMYVQAEGINVNGRSVDQRCVRKNNMTNIVFYEILVAQTNESIAQYEDTWNAPEYGPMVPMDAGECTPLSTGSDGKPVYPPECLQFNGDDKQPNVGPVVGGGIKEDEPRAPYPGNYWFSFPNSCPLEPWGNQKTDACRAKTRKGLCPVGYAPDGATCTFAYDILGWVPIDDVVGITAMDNEATGKKYQNFAEWCNSDKNNKEFSGDIKTGESDQGAKNLPFWDKPTSTAANLDRAQKVVDTYNMIVSGKYQSPQVNSSVLKYFKSLPTPQDLRKSNPPCYYSVKSCNTGSGCARTNYSQLCEPCSSKADGCEVNASYQFPKLVKAETPLTTSELTSGSKLNESTKGGYQGGKASGKSGSSSIVLAGVTVAASLAASLLL